MLMQYLWQPTLIFYRYFSHNPIILPTFVLAYPMPYTLFCAQISTNFLHKKLTVKHFPKTSIKI